MTKLIERSDFTKKNFISVSVRKFLGDVSVDLQLPGNEFDFNSIQEFSFDDDELENASETIRNIILRSFAEKLVYRHKSSFNTVRITALRSQYSELYRVMVAVALALAAGFLMKNFLGEEICALINENIFDIIRGFFLNGLKMCAVPVVFFSIFSCFSQASDMSRFKKTGMNLS